MRITNVLSSANPNSKISSNWLTKRKIDSGSSDDRGTCRNNSTNIGIEFRPASHESLSPVQGSPLTLSNDWSLFTLACVTWATCLLSILMVLRWCANLCPVPRLLILTRNKAVVISARYTCIALRQSRPCNRIIYRYRHPKNPKSRLSTGGWRNHVGALEYNPTTLCYHKVNPQVPSRKG
jgi:hypothetical protein